MGFTLRRFPLPQGSAAFRPGRTCIPLARRLFRRTRRRTGPTSVGFQVHTCWDCLATARFFKPTTAGASPGFCPSRVVPAKALPRTSPGLLSRAWWNLAVTRRKHPHLRVSVSLRLASPGPHRSAYRPKQPLWGSCTCPLPTIRVACRPGY